MPPSETAVTNLLYRYAECIDAGDLDGAAALFSHARVRVATGEIGADELVELWRGGIVLYDDGTPRTKHVITNAIVEVDEVAGRATCRSYYTVMQQAPGALLEPVICGRYHDEFERVDGEWRFSFRDYTLHDLVGDMSRHAQSWARDD
ncbi:MAG: nuclear transport factor 2 family protein [Acidimicrobiia bacterium]